MIERKKPIIVPINELKIKIISDYGQKRILMTLLFLCNETSLPITYWYVHLLCRSVTMYMCGDNKICKASLVMYVF